MTSPDPDIALARAVNARIKAETGIDLLDRSADVAGARAAMRRSFRRLGGALAGGLVGTLALICIVLAVVPSNGGATISIGLRVGFAIVGIAIAVAFTKLILWAWRTPAYYTELYLKRRQAQQRAFAEIGQPLPGGSATAYWLTLKAMIAFRTPSEPREMRTEAACRKRPPANPGKR